MTNKIKINKIIRSPLKARVITERSWPRDSGLTSLLHILSSLYSWFSSNIRWHSFSNSFISLSFLFSHPNCSQAIDWWREQRWEKDAMSFILACRRGETERRDGVEDLTVFHHSSFPSFWFIGYVSETPERAGMNLWKTPTPSLSLHSVSCPIHWLWNGETGSLDGTKRKGMASLLHCHVLSIGFHLVTPWQWQREESVCPFPLSGPFLSYLSYRRDQTKGHTSPIIPSYL